MNPRHREIEGPKSRVGCVSIAIGAAVLLFGIRTFASWAIDYQWWKEMGQLSTWFSMLGYSVFPTAAVTIIAFTVFWISHARALKHAGTGLREHSTYAKLTTLGFFLLALLLGLGAIDTWTVVRYFGGTRGGPVTPWHDPVFNNSLTFYLFELPFYSDLLGLVLGIAVLASIIYWAASRGWHIRSTMPNWSEVREINLADLGLAGLFDGTFLRGMGALFLLALAVRFFLGRYSMLLDEHGSFMVGIDYVDQNIALPIQWVLIASAVVAAVAILFGKWKIALVLPVAFLVRNVVPPIVNSTYVKPNEISMERPFIERHIAATRSAYGIDGRTREVEFPAKAQEQIDLAQHKPLLDNVRLWDWHAFHDAITQLQPYRPYLYSDTDVDRYTIDGQLRQVMISPREIDLNQLGEARTGWINPRFIYTHGYGVVMAEANRVSPNGLPELIIQNTPPEISVPGLKLTRPQLYYGENVHEPVFVRTAQPEFDYPAGDRNMEHKYEGTGGFPISSVLLRAAVAVSRGDWNMLLTNYLTAESRMMIKRNVHQRLDTLANFVSWDSDPYIVLTAEGRLVWMVDGYMTSNLHPYSRSIEINGIGAVNYIRNSVKATVDAYDGTVHLYVFDQTDPLLQAYRNLFPDLFEPESKMPQDLREHVRYPETIFAAEADIYRIFHMREPDTFYNKSDAWDTAKFSSEQGGKPGPVTPTYVVATLPGETKPEFLLMLSFTPRNRDNLIGLMMARCDGAHLGEKVVLLMPKQEIILGPMQIEARINQDQTISKDLTLWNQQGSQVLRGQMLVLPLGHTFLYVEPIYIQAQQAKMPQLKKVALAMGNNLVYADTYQQALAQLAGENVPTAPSVDTTAVKPPPPSGDQRVVEIRQHLQRYRELVSQGKLAEAGKELEAIQALVK